MLLSFNAANAAKPKFHCYIYPNATVAAYQTPVKCAKGDQMEIVCTYSAGCKPAKDGGEPPAKDPNELAVMITSGELKGSFLMCKGKGDVKDGMLVKAECPSATKCQGDGLFTGIPVQFQLYNDAVTAPVAPAKGDSRAIR